VSDPPSYKSNNRDRNGETVKNKRTFKNGSAAAHRTPTQAFKPGRTEERPPKRPFSASPSRGRQAPRGIAADEARNLWSPMAGVNTPLFRGQIRPWIGFSLGGSWMLDAVRTSARPGGPGPQQRAEARQEKIARCDVFREHSYTNASAVSAGAGPYFSGAIVKLARPWLTLRTAAE